jgi:hypothetical protein
MNKTLISTEIAALFDFEVRHLGRYLREIARR